MSVDIGKRTSDVVEWVMVFCVVPLALRLRFWLTAKDLCFQMFVLNTESTVEYFK